MTLIELLVVLAILVVVIGGLAQLFTSGIRSETDQTVRAQGQIDARLALDQLRREIHCATAVSPNPNGTWPTNAITITLGSWCSTSSAGSTVSVTWCTTGSGPYSLRRYTHTTDLSTASYAAACSGTGHPWIYDVVDSGSVTSGKIFSSPVTSTLPALAAPNLTYGSASGSLGSSSSDVTYSYLVDPVVSGVEQPGTENLITLRSGTTGKSILVDWTDACSVYASSGSVSAFKVYGRTSGGEQLLTTVSSSGCAATTWTDDGSATPSGSPVGATRTKLSVTLPVRADSSSHRLITLQDDLTLRNTPR